jgi:cytidine deaminase
VTSAEDLAVAARRAAEGSYSPYSQFRVGAVVVDADGRHHTGANVENAAYGSSICAEATAISGAVARGVRRIDTVAVACVDAESVDGAYPCGNCRQLMNEFHVQTVIVTAGDGSPVRSHQLAEIHPHGFFLD